MRIIEPSVEIYTEYDHFRKIETIARVCTGTQDKVGSKPGFVENLWKNRHETPFEHVRVAADWDILSLWVKSYGIWDRLGTTGDLEKRLTVNVRDYLTLEGKLEDLKELPEADDYMTVKFTVDIGVARELIRHRQMSFMERSTRYCNMSDCIDFIKPVPFAWDEFGVLSDAWYMECVSAEAAYRLMIRKGARPQEARAVLPLSTATVLYVTGMYKQWEDMLKLRLAPGAHPQMRYIMQKLVELEDFPKDKIKVPEFEHFEKKN
jgi:thymidylate synthase ThyX